MAGEEVFDSLDQGIDAYSSLLVLLEGVKVLQGGDGEWRFMGCVSAAAGDMVLFVCWERAAVCLRTRLKT